MASFVTPHATEARANLTLEKGLDILSLFGGRAAALSVPDIQRELDIPQSTLYRLLRSMKSKGWVEDDASGRYRLGLRILDLARVVQRRLDVVEVARPVMQNLSETTGETILLTKISGQQAICIERVEGPQLVRVSMERGVLLPLHAGASATILLAYLDGKRRDEILAGGDLTRFTENTLVDPEVIRRRLERIRENGYAFSDHEVDQGARSIGAPIFDPDGQITAGISLVAPAGRLPDARIPDMARLVKEAAASITALLQGENQPSAEAPCEPPRG